MRREIISLNQKCEPLQHGHQHFNLEKISTISDKNIHHLPPDVIPIVLNIPACFFLSDVDVSLTVRSLLNY